MLYAHPRDFTKPQPWGLFPGNAGGARTPLLELGGFDERDAFGVAAEDNDLAWRWLRTGRSIRYRPELIVWHHDWRTDKEIVDRYVEYGRGQGALYAKHLKAGDLRIAPWLARDVARGLRAQAGRYIKRRAPHTDWRQGLFPGVPRRIRARCDPTSTRQAQLAAATDRTVGSRTMIRTRRLTALTVGILAALPAAASAAVTCPATQPTLDAWAGSPKTLTMVPCTSDVAAPVTYTVLTAPINGTATPPAADGKFVFTGKFVATGDPTGPDSVTFSASDGGVTTDASPSRSSSATHRSSPTTSPPWICSRTSR